MATLKIDIGGEAYERLCAWAVAERRPVSFEAEVLLFRALGCWPNDTVGGQDGDKLTWHACAECCLPCWHCRCGEDNRGGAKLQAR
jgi:hypothetical protein